MKMVYSDYTEPIKLVMCRERLTGHKAAETTNIRDKIAELKRLVVELFQDRCGNILFSMNIRLIDHLAEVLEAF